MVTTYGRVVGTGRGATRIELDISGQIVDFSGGKFLLGDPVALSIENGQVQDVKRAPKKFIRSGPEHESLGEYWRRP